MPYFLSKKSQTPRKAVGFDSPISKATYNIRLAVSLPSLVWRNSRRSVEFPFDLYQHSAYANGRRWCSNRFPMHCRRLWTSAPRKVGGTTMSCCLTTPPSDGAADWVIWAPSDGIKILRQMRMHDETRGDNWVMSKALGWTPRVDPHMYLDAFWLQLVLTETLSRRKKRKKKKKK